MGCDIHLYTEKLIKINGAWKWVNCDNWGINHHYNPEDPDCGAKWEVNHIYQDRNYYLFSILANVRNYSGNEFIENPRGLPEDVSQQVKEEADEWGVDGHSHSWFTLAELKSFAKTIGPTKYSGMVSKEDAAKINAGIMPDSWCQSTTREDFVYMEWTGPDNEDPMFGLVEKLDARNRGEFYRWHADDVSDIDPRFRIVFWFDN